MLGWEVEGEEQTSSMWHKQTECAQEPWQNRSAACVRWDNKFTSACLHVVMFSSLATQAEQEHPQWGGRAGLGLPRAQQHPGSGSELNQPLLPHPQPPCWDEALWDTSVHQPRLSSHSIYWLHCLK